MAAELRHQKHQAPTLNGCSQVRNRLATKAEREVAASAGEAQRRTRLLPDAVASAAMVA